MAVSHSAVSLLWVALSYGAVRRPFRASQRSRACCSNRMTRPNRTAGMEASDAAMRWMVTG